MKKKSLSVRKKIHKKLVSFLKDQRINRTYNLFIRNLKTTNKNPPFAVAVSGGPDSLALTFLFMCFSIKNDTKIFFYHVDHRLRQNSQLEGKILYKNLLKYGIKTKILVWKGKKPKSNIQSLARNERYALILKQSKKDKVNSIFTAHHEDDFFENFFIRLLRGSGLEGFVSFNSIENKSNKMINIVRPLINISKFDLNYISKKVFDFVITDPSNKNTNFKRIRMRNLINNLKNEGFNLNKLKLSLNNLTKSNEAINYFVDLNIIKNSKFTKKKSICILNKDFFLNPEEIIFRSFSKILQKVGNKYYRPRGKSISKVIESIHQKKFKKMTLSSCIIEKINNSVVIYNEFKKIS